MNDRIGEHLKVQRSALNILVQRQEMIASNIANADTPHYKARDVDFRAALQGALNASREGVQMATTQAGHIGSAPAPALESLTGYRSELQSAVDGNTVNMDVERAAFAENALQMEAMLTFINGRFRSLASAIQGQ